MGYFRVCPEFPPPLGPPLQTYIPTLMGVRFFEIAIPLVEAFCELELRNEEI